MCMLVIICAVIAASNSSIFKVKRIYTSAGKVANGIVHLVRLNTAPEISGRFPRFWRELDCFKVSENTSGAKLISASS